MKIRNKKDILNFLQKPLDSHPKTCHNLPMIEYIAMGAKPDPFKFSIVKFEHHSEFLTIIEAKYEGCKTYDGHKLMLVMNDTPYQDPNTRQSLDPHFMGGHCVIARFEPIALGWELARLCAKTIKVNYS